MPTFVGTPTTGTPVTSGTSMTFAHTTVGAAQGLVGGCGLEMSGGGDIDCDSFAWNGDALTMIEREGGAVLEASLWLMINPDIGSFNAVAGWTIFVGSLVAAVAGVADVGTLKIDAGVAGAHRTAYIASGTSTTPTVTDADSQSGDLVAASASGASTTIAVGAGQTSQCESDNFGSSGTSWSLSTEAATGANTVMSYTLGASGTWSIVSTALIDGPAAAAGWGHLIAGQRNRHVMQ